MLNSNLYFAWNSLYIKLNLLSNSCHKRLYSYIVTQAHTRTLFQTDAILPVGNIIVHEASEEIQETSQ